MSETVITMVQCPYCHKEWVDEFNNLVCDKCKPQVDVDMALQSIREAVYTLSRTPTRPYLTSRSKIMKHLANEFSHLTNCSFPEDTNGTD